MAIDASPAVGAEWNEEGMTFSVHRSGRVEHAERAFGAVESVELRQNGVAVWLDPGGFEGGLILRAEGERDSERGNENKSGQKQSSHDVDIRVLIFVQDTASEMIQVGDFHS